MEIKEIKVIKVNGQVSIFTIIRSISWSQTKQYTEMAKVEPESNVLRNKSKLKQWKQLEFL